MSRFISRRFDALEAYVPGEQPRDRRYVKLNTNESPYPPAPGVAEKINRAAIEGLKLYNDPDGTRLREKLAETYNVTPENVILGNGSDEVLFMAFAAFADADHGVAFPDISYGFYSVYADYYNLDAKVVPLADDLTVRAEDYHGLNRLIVIANPNAPTGLKLSNDEIEGILKTNPDNVVLIDEAYVDFGNESCLPLIEKYDNLLVVRTYSKSRNLAGARLGFGLANKELIADMNKLRNSSNPYNINSLTLIAGEAALEDPAYFEDCCKKVIATREATEKSLAALGFELTKSNCNFVFARHPEADAGKMLTLLRDRGFLVRYFNKPRISDYLRITIGTPEEMTALTAALAEILASGAAAKEA